MHAGSGLFMSIYPWRLQAKHVKPFGPMRLCVFYNDWSLHNYYRRCTRSNLPPKRTPAHVLPKSFAVHAPYRPNFVRLPVISGSSPPNTTPSIITFYRKIKEKIKRRCKGERRRLISGGDKIYETPQPVFRRPTPIRRCYRGNPTPPLLFCREVALLYDVWPPFWGDRFGRSPTLRLTDVVMPEWSKKWLLF